METKTQMRELLEKAWGDMEVVFEVAGVHREDGRTAAQIEAEARTHDMKEGR